MKINRETLAATLASAAKVAAVSGGVEIGQAVLLSAEGDKLTIRATDFSVWIDLSAPCVGELEPCAVHAGRILETVSSMRSDAVDMSVDGGHLTIKGDRGAKRRMATISHGGFPVPATMGDAPSVTLDCARFRDAVEFVAPHMARDTVSLGYLCGVHVEYHDHGARLTATNGKMLARAGVSECDAFDDVTLSQPFLDAVMRDLPDDGSFTLVLAERAAQATWSGGSVRGPCVEGAFPLVDRIIPTACNGKLAVNADEFVAASKAARTLGEQRKGSTAVALVMGETVQIEGRSQQGEAVEPMDAEWSGEALRVGMFAGDAVTGLAKFGSAALEAQFVDALSPIVFRADKLPDRLVVLTPCRI